MKFTSSIMALVGLALLPMAFANVVPTIVTKDNTGLGVHDNWKHFPTGVNRMIGSVDGHEFDFNGTIQELNAYIKSKHPDFDPDKLVAQRLAHEKQVKARNDLASQAKTPPPLCCPVAGQDWQYAQGGRIQEGIDYLKNVKASCWTPPGICNRISCSWNAAIFLCNDNNYAIEPSCPYMASYAQDIMNKCIMYTPVGYPVVCGQEFDTDHYNIVVREDRC